MRRREQAGQIISVSPRRHRPLQAGHRFRHVIAPQRRIVARRGVLLQAPHRPTNGISSQRRTGQRGRVKIFPRVIDSAHGRAKRTLPQRVGETRGVKLFLRWRHWQPKGAPPSRGRSLITVSTAQIRLSPSVLIRGADRPPAIPTILLRVFPVDVATTRVYLHLHHVRVMLLQLHIPEQRLQTTYRGLLMRGRRHVRN